jgi:hypothetical protein
MRPPTRWSCRARSTARWPTARIGGHAPLSRQFQAQYKRLSDRREWLSTDVDAPPRLANLAALEKARATTSIFPIQLDHAGMIMSRENHRSPALNESEAQAARQLIDGAALKPDAQHQAIEFLDQVAKQTGPVISHWPASLFRPGPFNSEIQRELPPTNGESGMAIISISAQSTKPCSLMKKLERKVKTVIGGQMRETREIWTLDPAKD